MLEWIISSSVLIAVIILLRFVLRGKIGLRLQYALWALVLARLLLPFSIGSSNISIMNPVEKLPVYQDMLVPGIMAPESQLPANPSMQNTGMPPAVIPDLIPSPGRNEQTEQNAGKLPNVQEPSFTQNEVDLDLLTLLRAVWLSGGVILGAWFVVTNLLFAAKLRKNRIINGNTVSVAGVPL